MKPQLSSVDPDDWPERFVILESAYKAEQTRISAENTYLRHSLWELTKIVAELRKEVSNAQKTVEAATAMRIEVQMHQKIVAKVHAIMAKDGWQQALRAAVSARNQEARKPDKADK